MDLKDHMMMSLQLLQYMMYKILNPTWMIMKLILLRKHRKAVDDNYPSSEKGTDSNFNGQMDSQYASRNGRYNLRP